MSDWAQKRLLLVEDEVIIALTEKMALEKYGYAVAIANTSDEAFDLFRKDTSIDLVLMDIDLGDGGDGTEAARKILAERDIPVIFLSNQTEAEIIQKIEKIASYGYVIKNSGITILDASIKMAFKLFDAHRLIRDNDIKQKTMIANITDVVGINDLEGVILYKSPNIEKWFGWKPSDLVGTSSWLTVHPDDRERIKQELAAGIGEANAVKTVEYRYLCKDGTHRPIELTATNLAHDPAINGILINYHDISERKRAEETLGHVVRLYALLSEINQAIVRIKERDELLETICRVAIRHGHFRLAWIGLVSEGDGKIGAVTAAGKPGVELDRILQVSGIEPTERIETSADLFSLQDPAGLDREILALGCRSSASVPFRRKGSIAGAVYLYSAEPAFFADDEQLLLEEIGDDISFALEAMDSEIERKRAEEAVLAATLNITQREVETLSVLGRASEYKDPETANHITRVSHAARFIAAAMGLDEAQQELIFLASPLHDVGKLGIPDSLLLKPGSLSEEEFEKMKTHTRIGFEILKSSRSPFLQAGAEIALTHHEKYAGNGYPNSLREKEIPLFGRIVAVADAWDAMVSKRPYKEAWPTEKALTILVSEKGRHFDPAVVDAFLTIIPDVEHLYEKLQD